MKITEVKKLDDCFDGSYLRELFFDTPFTREIIVSLKAKGALKYYPSFARPFFSFEVENCMNVKGVEGNYSARIWIKNENAVELFENMLE